MTDNVVVLDGYTEGYIASNGMDIELFILVKPETDLDSRFKAWDSDEQDYIVINGWLFTFEAVQ